MNTATDKSRKALGKGLSALLPSRTAIPTSVTPTSVDAPKTLPVDSIQANPMQPRTAFHTDRLTELANSIRAHGIIQPLIVRKIADSYQIVAGERRWRAAKLAGLQDVPVVIPGI